MTLQEIYNKEFKLTTNGQRLSQADSNQLKDTMTGLIMEVLQEHLPSIDFIQGAKEILMLIPNEHDGTLPMTINIVNKPLNTDSTIYEIEYQDKLAKIAEKKAKQKLLEEKKKGRKVESKEQ